MAIQVSGTTVINNSRALNNITSVDATTAAAIGNAGVGAPAAGDLGGNLGDWFGTAESTSPGSGNSWESSNRGVHFKIGNTYFSAAKESGGNGRLLAKNSGSGWSSAYNWQGSNNAAWENQQAGNTLAWDGGNVYMICFPNYYGGILRTTNGGSSWAISSIVGGNYRYVYGICWAGSGYWLALQTLDAGTYLYRSTNNGSSWSQVASLASTGSPRSIYSSGSTTIYAGSDGFYRSTNFKTGWSATRVFNFSNTNYRWQTIRTNGSGNWVTSQGWWSTNDGVTWNDPSNVPYTQDETTNLTYFDGKFVLFSGDSYCYSTTGEEWTHVPSGFGFTTNSNRKVFVGFDNPTVTSSSLTAAIMNNGGPVYGTLTT